MEASTFRLNLKSASGHKREIRGLAHAFWAGTIDMFTFVDSMVGATVRGYNQAWAEGERAVGIISPEERGPEEMRALEQVIRDDVGRIMALADFIRAHARDQGKLFRTVQNRIELWANRYQAIVNQAMALAGRNRKMAWVLGMTEVHCGDCLTYSGQVHRASVWREWGAVPQSRHLECGGWHCDCHLKPTSAPGTPGHPQRPRGRTP